MDGLEIRSTDLNAVRLPSLGFIGNNFIIQDNKALRFIELPALIQVGQNFKVSNQLILSSLVLNSLQSVTDLEISNNHGLRELKFNAGLASVRSLKLVDNTFESVQGLHMQSVHSLLVTSHPNLKTLELRDMNRAYESFEVSNNNPQLELHASQITDIDGDAIFTSLRSIDTPLLTTVKGNLYIDSTGVTDAKFPHLNSVSQSLAIFGNENLHSTDFPKLSHVGGTLSITNNPNLAEFNGFPILKTVDGSLEIEGPKLEQVALPPMLHEVRGGVFVKAAKGFDCNSLSSTLHGVVLGEMECVTGTDELSKPIGGFRGSASTGKGDGNKKDDEKKPSDSSSGSEDDSEDEGHEENGSTAAGTKKKPIAKNGVSKNGASAIAGVMIAVVVGLFL